jgi:hypothetical protein
VTDTVICPEARCGESWTVNATDPDATLNEVEAHLSGQHGFDPTEVMKRVLRMEYE